jgi:toxin ParE1/3/4
MTDYRLSAAAESDIEAIYRYTFDTFGPVQADRYVDGLGQAFQRIADMPEIGRKADDLRSGLLRYLFQSHMIFYTNEHNEVVIRRILHARMDFGSRL